MKVHLENLDGTRSPSVHSSLRRVWHFYTFNTQPLMANLKEFIHPQLFHNKRNIFSAKREKIKRCHGNCEYQPGVSQAR